MKKYTLIVLAVLAMLAVACSGITIDLGNNDTIGNQIRISGSGPTQTETREVSGFDKIEFNSIGQLIITQGDEESLTVEAQENVLEHLVTEVRGGTLYIETERTVNLDVDGDIIFTLTVKDLSELNLNGMGSVELGEMETETMRLDVNGAGSIDVEKLTANRLDASLSGLGSLDITGTVDELELSIPGSGNFDGRDLQARSTTVRLAGLGSAQVWSTESLDVEISGAGNVEYYGNPDVDQNISGLGRVEHMGNK